VQAITLALVESRASAHTLEVRDAIKHRLDRKTWLTSTKNGDP
jgi:hypothetical protein